MKLCIRTLRLVFVLAALNVVILNVSCQDSYSCAGSSRCGSLAQRDCTAAREKITDPRKLYFTTGSKSDTGVCAGNCGLFVSGRNCDLSGQEMIDAFNELRARNCAKCGIKTYNDGCQFKADYVTGC